MIAGPTLTYVKLGAAAVLLAGAAAGGWHFGSLSKDDELNRYKTTVEAQHATQLSALATAWQNRELETQAKDNRHDTEMATLRAARSGPLPGFALRVCPSTPGPVVSAGGREAAEPPAGGTLPAGDGRLPQGDGDQRPGLYVIADEADDLLADCRETQPAARAKTP